MSELARPGFHVSSARIAEGDAGTTRLVFEISMTNRATTASDGIYTLAYRTVETGSALAGEDFQPIRGSVTLSADRPTVEVVVPILGDLRVEDDEWFTLQVESLATAANAVQVARGKGMILDDDGKPNEEPGPSGIKIGDARIKEGDEGRAQLTFTLEARAPAGSDRNFDYYTVDGSAVAGEDYIATRGQVTLPAGHKAAEIGVTILGDTVLERSEDFELIVTPAAAEDGAVIAIAYSATGLIIDDDTNASGREPEKRPNEAGDADPRAESGTPVRILPIPETAEEVRGGEGLDTAVVSGRSGDAAISLGVEEIVLARGDSVVRLNAVERIRFDDGTIAFDAGPASVYRLYQAALGREPDAGGLGYWVERTDEGASLMELSEAFIGSGEFRDRFRENLDDEAFVGRLYENVLDREADRAGLLYWSDTLEQGAARADVLTDFANSPENISRTANATDDGVWYV